MSNDASATVEPAVDGRRARGDASRRTILDAATGCIAVDGVSTLTHRSVAAAADLSPARVSYHFPTIEDLLVAASSAYLADFDDRLRERAEAARLGEQSIVEVCTDVLYELVSTDAQSFLGMVEVRLALARRRRKIDDAGIVTVIRSFGADEDRARSIAAAMFGFAVLAASEPGTVPREVVRNHVRTVLGTGPLGEATEPEGRAAEPPERRIRIVTSEAPAEEHRNLVRDPGAIRHHPSGSRPE